MIEGDKSPHELEMLELERAVVFAVQVFTWPEEEEETNPKQIHDGHIHRRRRGSDELLTLVQYLDR